MGLYLNFYIFLFLAVILINNVAHVADEPRKTLLIVDDLQ